MIGKFNVIQVGFQAVSTVLKVVYLVGAIVSEKTLRLRGQIGLR